MMLSETSLFRGTRQFGIDAMFACWGAFEQTEYAGYALQIRPEIAIVYQRVYYQYGRILQIDNV